MATPLITAPSESALHLAPFTTAALFVFIGGFLIPLPQEAVLVAVGFIFGDRHLSLPIAILASLSAVILSDNIFYALARVGSPIVTRLRRRLNPAIVERYAKEMRAHPGRTIFWVRFIPGVRVLAPLLSGLSRGVRLWVYELANAAAAVIYVPAYVVMGYFFHGSIESLVDSVQLGQNTAFAVALIAVTAAAGFKVSHWVFRRGGRPIGARD